MYVGMRIREAGHPGPECERHKGYRHKQSPARGGLRPPGADWQTANTRKGETPYTPEEYAFWGAQRHSRKLMEHGP